MPLFVRFGRNAATTELSFTSLITTAPAPIKTFLPMMMFGNIVAFVLIVEKFPISTIRSKAHLIISLFHLQTP